MEIDPKDAFEIQFFEAITKRNPSDHTALELLGALYSKYGQHKKTLRIDRRLVKQDNLNSRNHYNLACSLCVLDRKKEALDSLQTAIKMGYEDFDWLMKDPDLKSLHSLPEFEAILAKIRQFTA